MHPKLAHSVRAACKYLLAWLCLWPCAASWADTSPIGIRLGAENSWPPYSDSQGQGISTQLVKAAFALRDIKPSFYVQPYARVLHDLKHGKIDGGYNVTLQESTRELFVFGDLPLLTPASYWFFLPGKHLDIHSIKDIPLNFRVGAILDYEYGDDYEQLRHSLSETRVSQQAQLIRMLQQERLDAVLMFEDEAKYSLRQMQLPPTTLEQRMFNHRAGVYVAFSKQNPQARWLAKELDKGLQMLHESGAYQQLITLD